MRTNGPHRPQHSTYPIYLAARGTGVSTNQFGAAQNRAYTNPTHPSVIVRTPAQAAQTPRHVLFQELSKFGAQPRVQNQSYLREARGEVSTTQYYQAGYQAQATAAHPAVIGNRVVTYQAQAQATTAHPAARGTGVVTYQTSTQAAPKAHPAARGPKVSIIKTEQTAQAQDRVQEAKPPLRAQPLDQPLAQPLAQRKFVAPLRAPLQATLQAPLRPQTQDQDRVLAQPLLSQPPTEDPHLNQSQVNIENSPSISSSRTTLYVPVMEPALTKEEEELNEQYKNLVDKYLSKRDLDASTHIEILYRFSYEVKNLYPDDTHFRLNLFKKAIDDRFINGKNISICTIENDSEFLDIARHAVEKDAPYVADKPEAKEVFDKMILLAQTERFILYFSKLEKLDKEEVEDDWFWLCHKELKEKSPKLIEDIVKLFKCSDTILAVISKELNTITEQAKYFISNLIILEQDKRLIQECLSSLEGNNLTQDQVALKFIDEAKKLYPDDASLRVSLFKKAINNGLIDTNNISLFAKKENAEFLDLTHYAMTATKRMKNKTYQESYRDGNENHHLNDIFDSKHTLDQQLNEEGLAKVKNLLGPVNYQTLKMGRLFSLYYCEKNLPGLRNMLNQDYIDYLKQYYEYGINGQLEYLRTFIFDENLQLKKECLTLSGLAEIEKCKKEGSNPTERLFLFLCHDNDNAFHEMLRPEIIEKIKKKFNSTNILLLCEAVVVTDTLDFIRGEEGYYSKDSKLIGLIKIFIPNLLAKCSGIEYFDIEFSDDLNGDLDILGKYGRLKVQECLTENGLVEVKKLFEDWFREEELIEDNLCKTMTLENLFLHYRNKGNHLMNFFNMLKPKIREDIEKQFNSPDTRCLGASTEPESRTKNRLLDLFKSNNLTEIESASRNNDRDRERLVDSQKMVKNNNLVNEYLSCIDRYKQSTYNAGQLDLMKEALYERFSDNAKELYQDDDAGYVDLFKQAIGESLINGKNISFFLRDIKSIKNNDAFLDLAEYAINANILSEADNRELYEEYSKRVLLLKQENLTQAGSLKLYYEEYHEIGLLLKPDKLTQASKFKLCDKLLENFLLYKQENLTQADKLKLCDEFLERHSLNQKNLTQADKHKVNKELVNRYLSNIEKLNQYEVAFKFSEKAKKLYQNDDSGYVDLFKQAIDNGLINGENIFLCRDIKSIKDYAAFLALAKHVIKADILSEVDRLDLDKEFLKRILSSQKDPSNEFKKLYPNNNECRLSLFVAATDMGLIKEGKACYDAVNQLLPPNTAIVPTTSATSATSTTSATGSPNRYS